MTTIAELIDTAPVSTDGLPIDWDDSGGGWRGVFQLADPLAGAAVEWFDLSEYLLGYNLTKGASTYAGRPEATVANIEVMADNGLLAPTNPDTSVLFGDHIDLGPGLLVRFSLIRVAGGVVVEWLPRFTLKVEYWGNASHARGRIRRHLIVARDTFTSLVDVPVAAADPQDWSDKVIHITTGASWQYGILAYHDFDLLLPERDEQDSSVRELDAALDPAGLVWFTDRYGHLYIRPRPGDTLHTGAGYTLPWLSFHYLATDLTSGLIAYAVDYDAVEPFGLAKSETGVKNRVQITSPGGTFDQDDATSTQRFDPKVYRATWIADNDQAAADLLAYRAYAEMEATPLYTCIGQPGFHDLLLADYLNPAGIEHSFSDNEEATSASGVVRRLEESAVFAGPCVDMSIKTTLDIETFSTVTGLILPVEDLAVAALGDTGAVFSWTNPTQVVTPTHTQIRMIGVTSIWFDYPYPITGVSWGGLAPNTGYQFQVRLVQLVDGVVTAASSIRLINFTTTFTTPVIDDDGGGVTFPPPECGTLDWELQESDDGTTWSVVDDGTISAPPFTIDLSGYMLDPTKLYRIWQDACGDESYSYLFVGACSEPPALGAAPFDDVDLVAYWPAVCPPSRIVEALTESPALLGPCFDTFVLDGDFNIVLVADGEGAVAYGFTPGTPVPGDSDITIAAKVIVSSQPDDPVTLFGYEGIAIQAYAHGAKWALRAVVSEDGAGFTTLSSGTDLDFGTWIDLAAVHDVGADDLKIYVNGVQVGSALGSVGERTSPGTFSIGQSDNGLITNCAVWDRVLAPAELPGYIAPPTVTINKGSGQADPTAASPIIFDVVFSEAVSGFATGDITLSGTAGATTAVVSGTGPSYTVTVTGMTGAGTVIASIAAAVCTSVATGVANAASTSTDNNVAYTVFDPVTSIGWAHLYYAGGPAFAALGLADGASMAATNWPDEIAANAAPLTGGGGTYQAANAAVNSKPSVDMPGSGSGKKHTATVGAGAQVSLPYSIVCVFQMDAVNNNQYMMDGANDGSSGNRVLFRIGSSGAWSLFMGTDRTGGTPATGLHAARIHAVSGNDILRVDGSLIINNDSGGGTWQGLTFSENTVEMNGRWAFCGIYAGDITAHGSWSALQAWMLSHYGITLT